MLLWPVFTWFLLANPDQVTPQFIRMTPHPHLLNRGYWEVDPFFFEEIQRDLKPYLQQRFNPDHPIVKNFGRYRFQVVGYPSSQSPHFVLVSAFCADRLGDLQSNLVLQAHGADCFYVLFYSLRSHSFVAYVP